MIFLSLPVWSSVLITQTMRHTLNSWSEYPVKSWKFCNWCWLSALAQGYSGWHSERGDAKDFSIYLTLWGTICLELGTSWAFLFSKTEKGFQVIGL